MAAVEDAAVWAAELERLGAGLAPRFGRIEPRRRALSYLRGLLASVERKNGWQLAEAAGDRTPDGRQDFLARLRWDADEVRDGCGLMGSSIWAMLRPCWSWTVERRRRSTGW